MGTVIASILCIGLSNAQTISNSNYATIGFIKSDGTIQDKNYKTIGHAKGIPTKWATLYYTIL